MRKLLYFIVLFLVQSAYSQEWQNHVSINGVEFRLTEHDIIKKKGDIFFILKEDSLQRLYFREASFPGRLKYMAFTLDSLENPEYVQTYQDLPPAAKAQLEALMKDSTVRKLNEYSPSKPYQLYTNPETMFTHKYYDIKITPDGRLISEREFQSYKGNFTFIKMIRGGDFAMDTSIIIPPTKKDLQQKEQTYDDFHNQIGKQIPNFEVQDIDGNTYSSDELEGKILVLNFWFIGCPPCIREMPQLNELEEFYSTNEDVVFIGFTTDTEYRLRLFEESGYSFNYINIPESIEISTSFNVPVYPAHLVVDKQGIIQFTFLGDNEEIAKKLSSEIDKLINL